MASLSVSQLGNYLLPLLAIPFLTRVLGAEKYGVVAFAQVVISYLTILVNFGFDMSASREIALHRDDPAALSRIFTHTLFAKFLLLILSSLVLLLLIQFKPFSEDRKLLWITQLINIGFLLLPNWFFQGIERLRLIALLNFLIKLLFTVAIFLVIRTPEDYLFCNLALSVSQVLIGALGLSLALYRHDVRLTPISWKETIALLKEGRWMFYSMAIISGYTSTNVLMIGLLMSDRQVGYFNVLYKIIFAVHGLILLPFNLAFFPHITRAFHQEFNQAVEKLQRAGRALLVVTLACGAGLALFSRLVLRIFGSDFPAVAPVLMSMCILPALMGLVNVYGFNGLVALKKDRQFMRVTLLGSALSIIVNLVFIPIIGLYGSVLAWVVSELVIFIACYLLFNKYRKQASVVKTVVMEPEESA